MIGQEYFWILECFESDVETENGMMVELPSAGVVASSWDYIFKIMKMQEYVLIR
jgi:hypothetical protein